MDRDELDKIRLIYEAINKILQFTKGIETVNDLTSDLLIWDAVKLNLIVIYETDLKLSQETKEKYNNVDWSKIQKHAPNVLNIHLGFNSNEIWKLIWEEIPEFKEKLKEIVKS